MHKKTQEKTKNKGIIFPNLFLNPQLSSSFTHISYDSLSLGLPKHTTLQPKTRKSTGSLSSKNQWPPHSSTTHISLLTKNHLSFTYTSHHSTTSLILSLITTVTFSSL